VSHDVSARPGPRWARIGTLVAVTVAIWLLGLLRFRSWRANDDIAVLQLGLERMADGDIPLVGAYSRFGFFHPGPLREWVIGISYHASGGRAAAIPATALIINLGLVGLALIAAHRYAARRGVVAASGALVLTQIGMGAALHSAWNPHLAVLAGAALGWGVVALIGDGPRNWWLVVVPGSVLGQLHVAGLALFTVALVTLVAVLLKAGDVRRLLQAAAATVALWIGPLLDLAKGGDSNLSAFFDRETGTAQGADALGALVRLITPWSLAAGDVTSASVPGASWIETLIIVGAIAAATSVLIRHRHTPVVIVAGVALVVTAVLGAMLVEPVFAYLWAPLVGVTTLVTGALLLAAVDLIGDRWSPPPATAVLLGAAVVGAAIAASLVGWWSLRPIETASLQRTIEATIPRVVGDGEEVRIRTGGNVLSLAHAEVALAAQQAGAQPTSNSFELSLPAPRAGTVTLVTAMTDVLDCLEQRLHPLALVMRHPSQATGLDVGVFRVEATDTAILDDCGVAP